METTAILLLMIHVAGDPEPILRLNSVLPTELCEKVAAKKIEGAGLVGYGSTDPGLMTEIGGRAIEAVDKRCISINPVALRGLYNGAKYRLKELGDPSVGP